MRPRQLCSVICVEGSSLVGKLRFEFSGQREQGVVLEGRQPVLGETGELRRHQPGEAGDLLTRGPAVRAVEVTEVLVPGHGLGLPVLEVLRVHRDDVDLGPGLEDAQLLQGGGGLVVVAQALLQLVRLIYAYVSKESHMFWKKLLC